ncbi:MAG: hypothetical protein Kow0090_22320 [Myxococcota bacterium]
MLIIEKMDSIKPEAIDFTIMFVLGLVSSLHCVGMCGPIIAVASAPIIEEGEAAKKRWSSLIFRQIYYHLGRGITYAAIGFALAFFGKMITGLFSAREAGGIIQIILGAVIIGATINLLFRGRGVSAPSGGRFSIVLRKLMTSEKGMGMFALGLLTGFLPCGVLYAAFARSIAAGSPIEGSVLMSAFWLGTVPLLFALGLFSAKIFRIGGKALKIALVIVMLATGGNLILKGYRNAFTDGAMKHTYLQYGDLCDYPAYLLNAL